MRWRSAHDTQPGRQVKLAALPAAQQRGILFEAVNQIQLGAMPLPQFVKLHPGAAVTASS